MRKKLSAFAVLLSVIVSIALGHLSGYKAGYDRGYDLGNDSGYSEGYDAGQSDKSDELAAYQYTEADMVYRFDSGYRKGMTDGKTNGYSIGFNDGYAKGKAEAKATGQSSDSTSKNYTPKQPSYSSQTNSQTVYVTNTGSKYHRYGCQYLRQSCISISLSDAKAQGYTACSRCW